MKKQLVELMIKSFYLSIFGLPLAVTASPLVWLDNSFLKLAYLMFSPLIYIVSYIGVSGSISKLGQAGIKSGRFKRNPMDPVYSKRRIYGLSWTSVFYFKPLYWFVLSNPALKKFTFRMFGYKGQLDFTIYPDTWIRDLVVLDIGKGAYIANRVCLGSNQVSRRGNFINVGSIVIGEYSVVGFGAAIGPGAEIGQDSEIGVQSMIGVRCKIGNKVVVRPNSLINHGAILEDNVTIGTSSHIGMKCVIKQGLKIPEGSVIPDGMIFATQGEVDAFLASKRDSASTNKAKLSLVFDDDVDSTKMVHSINDQANSYVIGK